MPTFAVTTPTGEEYEVDVPEGATEQDAINYVRSQGDTPENESKPFNINDPLYEGQGPGERFVEGAKTLLKQARETLLPPANPTTLFSKDQAGANRETRERQADTRKAVERLKSGGLGTAGEIGYHGTEAAISAIPITRAGTAIGNVTGRVLPKAAERFAPAIGDVTANAAYSGGRTAAEGGDASDILKSTLFGAAGAAVPHGVAGAARAGGRAVGDAVTNVARRGVGAEARQLLDEGIPLTPGQIGQGNWMTRIEEGMKNVPGLGGAIERAQGRAASGYMTKEIDTALAPLERSVGNRTGREALDEAHRIVDESYNTFVKDVHIEPGDLRSGLVRLDDAITQTYSLTGKQERLLYDTVTKKISPALEAAAKTGRNISGRTFKNIDNRVGDLARKYTKSDNPDHHALGEAFYELQRQLRSSISPKRLGAAEDIRKANIAFKNMLALRKAGNREGGTFTPEQLRKVTGRMGEKPTALNKAAQKVLTKENTSGMNRSLLGGAIGIGGGLPHALAAVAGGSALGRYIYSPAGVKRMTEFLAPEQKVRLLGVPEKERSALMKKMIDNTPSLRQAAAQVGRELATDKEKENAS